MDQPRTERLLRLMMLLTANHTHTVETLAERLKMSPRTIYRYIDTFRAVGFVIQKDESNIYRIDKSSPYIKDLSDSVYFTDEESHLLRNAIDSLSASSRVAADLRRKLATVYDHKLLADVRISSENRKNITNLSEAIGLQQMVVLHGYRSNDQIRPTDYWVEPFKFTTNFEQVWCYHPKSETNMLFYTYNIESTEVLDVPWRYEEAHDSGFIDVFRNSSEYRWHIKLHMSLYAATLLSNEYPLAKECITPLAADQTLFQFETDVCDLEPIGRFILGVFNEIWILESDDLVEYVNDKIDCYYKNRDKNTDKPEKQAKSSKKSKENLK